ncbi:adhesion G -coupled receptor E3-like protein [Labeo rohita]|uniref:Adhesion G-coupled receptor E3-like protein n=1 Tax=Labeo rohita TaxID=84645 RepID=A0A498MBF1_LABRO|nr:adhesion G -coupled receptor E3-like protein [Labeo rohita]
MTPERIRAGGTTRSGTGPYQSPLEQRNWSRTDKDYGPGLDPVQTLPSQTSGGCFQNLLEQIENITAQVLPLNNVTNILTVAFNASEKILESLSSAKPTELASYGNHMLKTSEKLISTLVKPTVTNDNVSFTLATVDASETGLGAVLTQKRRQGMEESREQGSEDPHGRAEGHQVEADETEDHRVKADRTEDHHGGANGAGDQQASQTYQETMAETET